MRNEFLIKDEKVVMIIVKILTLIKFLKCVTIVIHFENVTMFFEKDIYLVCILYIVI